MYCNVTVINKRISLFTPGRKCLEGDKYLPYHPVAEQLYRQRDRLEHWVEGFILIWLLHHPLVFCTSTYEYTGNPQYLGSNWEQKYRGFNQVKENFGQTLPTDTPTGYILHDYYTTATINGQDAEKLTGREYRTQWYQYGNPNPLRKVDNTWSWSYTLQRTGITDTGTSIPLGTPIDVAVSPDGYGYAISSNSNWVLRSCQ